MKHRPRQDDGKLASMAVPNRSLVDSQASPYHTARPRTTRELVASIAHEVNQPLAAIVANAECCLTWLGTDQPDIARVRKAAERIVRNGHRASAVLNSMHAPLSVPTAEMSELDLNELIRDILDLMRTELSRCDVVLQIELCRYLGCIRGNRIQLQQVIFNLIKNGIESMSESPIRPLLVRVRTVMNGGLAVVAVEDCGPGIDTATAGRIFEPFFTTKRHGTGVGLSISRSIVEAHGGSLWAAGGETQGSVFQFTVPLIARQASMES
jgi:C4-dicarboxylate-specific signal transduction histidine kinase